MLTLELAKLAPLSNVQLAIKPTTVVGARGLGALGEAVAALWCLSPTRGRAQLSRGIFCHLHAVAEWWRSKMRARLWLGTAISSSTKASPPY